MSITRATTPHLIAAVVSVLVAGALGGCSSDPNGPPDGASSTSGAAAGGPEVGDCLAGGSPKGPYGEYYLLSDLTAVPCSEPHTLEIFAPGFSAGALAAVDAGEGCPSHASYLGWTQRPVWVSRLAVMTIVSSIETGAGRVRVFCASAVGEPFGDGQIRAVPTTGTVRDAASQPDAVARFGACMPGVPAVSQGVLHVPCVSGRELWVRGVVIIDRPPQKYPGLRKVFELSKRPCLRHVRQLTGSADTPDFSLQLPIAQAWISGWREAGCHVRFDAVRLPTAA